MFEDFKYKIYKLSDRVFGPVRQLFYGVRNIIDYAPIIYKDRNWDHAFFFYLMRKKLQRMEKCIRNGMHVDRERDANKIKLCILLVDRICKDNYFENATMFHRQKWGPSIWNFGPLVNKPNNSSLTFSYPNANTEEEISLCDKEMKSVYKHSDYMEQQDLDYLFSILAKHLKSWWD